MARTKPDRAVLNAFYIKKYGFLPEVPADKETQFYARVEEDYRKAHPTPSRTAAKAVSKRAETRAHARVQKRVSKKNIAHIDTKATRNKTKRALPAFFQRLNKRDQDYLMRVSVELEVTDHDGTKVSRLFEAHDVVKRKDAKGRARELVDEEIYSLKRDSGKLAVVPESGVTYKLTKAGRRPLPMTKVRARHAGALRLSGEGPYAWDRRLGTCVFDYIIHAYKDKAKKLCTYEKLATIFREVADVDEPDACPLTHGVNTLMLEHLCKEYLRINMYALDQDEMVFRAYICPKPDMNKKPLIFRIINNHFYPVEDASRRRSVSNSMAASDVVRGHRSTPATDEDDTPKTYSAMHAHERVKDPTEVLVSVMTRTGAQPLGKDIRYDGTLRSFAIDGELHIINQDMDEVRLLYARMGIDYSGQSDYNALFDIVKHVAKVELPRSTPNPLVHRILTTDGVKDRAHYGCVNGYTQERLEELFASGQAKSMDIRRCYSHCMDQPDDEWMLFDYNDCPTPFKGDLSKLGLYYAVTPDYTLLKGTNWYTNNILQFAAEQGIEFEVKQQLLCSNSAPKDLLRPILDAIKEVAPDSTMEKRLCNLLPGYFAKHTMTRHTTQIDSCPDGMWNWFKKAATDGRDIFKKPLDLGEDTAPTFLFGHKTTRVMSEVNIPWYLQITDRTLKLIYLMEKAMGGELAARKNDCVVTVGGRYPPPTPDVWGSSRKSALPKQLGPMRRNEVKLVRDRAWTTLPTNDSAQWEELLAAALKHGGLLIKGRAGTGKTYAVKQMAAKLEQMGRTTVKIAYTNKAALNIGGITIHKFLKMDKDHKMCPKNLKYIRDKVDFIIVDEVSLIAKAIWRWLGELKRATGVKFILLGDQRQCGPVETEQGMYHYFGHPTVKFLACHTQADLVVPHRYDAHMFELTEHLDRVNPAEFGSQMCTRNLCFLNLTRKRVNATLMEMHRPGSAILMPVGGMEHDREVQDVWLYDGLPLISRVTDKAGEAVSNETFTVTHVYERKKLVECSTTRPTEDGKGSRNHVILVPLADFHRRFLPNYCTTVHKAQGETITVPFTIWNWARMEPRLQYTALTRAKVASQINFPKAEDASAAAEDDVVINYRAIATKIAAHKAADKEAGRATNIDDRYIANMIRDQRCMCAHCHVDLLTDRWPAGDPHQFSIDRVNDKLGHIKGNVVISCKRCNDAHAHK